MDPLAKSLERYEKAREEERARLKNMSLDNFVRQISNAVYDATSLVEQMEHVQKVSGNGHHIRQEIAAAAGKMAGKRWIGKREE